jgi:hypothetical protein
MSNQTDSPRYYKPFETALPTEELEVTKLLYERMTKEDCLTVSERETLAYRIAEIMASAKRMYTKSLPRLTNINGESDTPMEDDLTGLQMTFEHLCDLMHEFRSTYLGAIKSRDDEDDNDRDDRGEQDVNQVYEGYEARD